MLGALWGPAPVVRGMTLTPCSRRYPDATADFPKISASNWLTCRGVPPYS
jgi:hypothetical protein